MALTPNMSGRENRDSSSISSAGSGSLKAEVTEPT
jgi:hypothetical protein